MKSSFGFTLYESLIQNSVSLVLNSDFYKIAYDPIVSKYSWYGVLSKSSLQKPLMTHPNNTYIISILSGKKKTF